MSKYKIETGIESKTSLTTIKHFDNAEELLGYIKKLDSATWFVVEYAKTGQRIVERNYSCSGTRYNKSITCPKALLGL